MSTIQPPKPKTKELSTHGQGRKIAEDAIRKVEEAIARHPMWMAEGPASENIKPIEHHNMNDESKGAVVLATEELLAARLLRDQFGSGIKTDREAKENKLEKTCKALELPDYITNELLKDIKGKIAAIVGPEK